MTGSIFKNCAAVFTKDDCIIEFESSSNVTRFGEIEHAQLEGNPDIAGLGVFIAFAALSIWSFIACFFKGVLLIIKILNILIGEHDIYTICKDESEKIPDSRSAFIHEKMDEAIISVADAQLFLVFAFVISFTYPSQCGVSFYHYRVAFHTVMIGLYGVMLSHLLVEEGQKKAFLSSIIRAAIFLFCLFRFISLSGLDESETEKNNSLSTVPGGNQTDSVLVLPAFCVLEDNLNTFSNLSDHQRQHLALDHQVIALNSGNQTAFILALGLVVILLRLKFLSDLCITIKHKDFETAVLRFVKFFVTIAVAYFMMSSIEIVRKLRTWIDRSVWLKREDGENPEQDVESIGQMAPLIGLVTIIIALTDIISFFIERTGIFKKCPLVEDDSGPRGNNGRERDEEGYPLHPRMSLSQARGT